MFYQITILFIILSVSLTSFAGIYGTDDRRDYFEITDSNIRDLARSTAHIVRKEDLNALPDGNFSLRGRSLFQTGFCSDVAFYEQMSLGHCSASLVGDDIILTAGHCFSPFVDDKSMSFKNMYVIFDYRVNDASQKEIIIKKEDVFEIKELNHYENPPLERPPKKGVKDLALAKLDRKVKRRPLKFNTTFNYPLGTNLFMLGHPFGLPLKYTDNASILSLDLEKHSFHHELDAFSGNSGSPIFNMENNEIIGVLVRGESSNQARYGRACAEWAFAKEGSTEEGTLLWDIHKFNR